MENTRYPNIVQVFMKSNKVIFVFNEYFEEDIIKLFERGGINFRKVGALVVIPLQSVSDVSNLVKALHLVVDEVYGGEE